MRRAVSLLCLLLLTFAGAHGAAAADEHARLLALDDEDHPEHEAALAWWEERSERERIAILRGALASNRSDVARLAAHGIGHTWLSSHEIARMVGLRLGDASRPYHEDASWGMHGEPPLGAPLLVAYVERVLREPRRFPKRAISTAHRVAKPEHARALLPLLERAPPELLRQVLFLITITGEHDRADRHRETIARGTYYGLLRIRAQRAGKPAPPLAVLPSDVLAPPEGGGIPPVAKAIAEACERDAPNGLARRKDEQDAMEARVDAGFWVRRWLLDTTPSTADIPFLGHVIDRGLSPRSGWPYAPAHVLWAMTHLCRFEGARGRDWVRAWARQREDVPRAWYASVALARQGEREPFDALRAAADAREIPKQDMPDLDLTWFVDRADARQRAAEAIRRLRPEYLDKRHALTPEYRRYALRDDGLRIEDADLEAIAAHLWKHADEDGHAGALRLLRFHTYVHPASLTPERARALLVALRAWLAREDATARPAYHDALNEDDLERALPLCEVRAPEATRGLLRWWARSKHEGRLFALECLARLGAEGHAEAYLQHWSGHEERDWRDRWHLGRVPGEAITAFLRGKAPREGEALDVQGHAEAMDALHALLLRAGLPRAIAPLFEGLQWIESDDAAGSRGLRAAWKAVLADDAVGALLQLADVAGLGVHALGAVDDPRAVAWLEARRRDRDQGLYWEATMARGGRDPAAARDVLGLIRAGRTWILEDLEGGGVRRIPAPVLTHELTAALDTNCCLGWAAHVLLQEVHPWLPFDAGFGGAGTEATRAYLAGHAWAHSEIFGGPVPAPR